ncbi:nicotinate-nucleotide--dimethylbenzimidazole phosphoribosyltransferase, partial [Streptococcus pyogenes]
NFVQGGAALSVLCRLNEIGLRVVNCGTATSCTEIAQVIHRPVMLGTYDFHQGAAMQPEQAQQALLIGKEQLDELQQAGCDFFMAG